MSHKVTMKLGEVCRWSEGDPVQFRYVYVTVEGHPDQITSNQVLTLPEDEARRFVNIWKFSQLEIRSVPDLTHADRSHDEFQSLGRALRMQDPIIKVEILKARPGGVPGAFTLNSGSGLLSELDEGFPDRGPELPGGSEWNHKEDLRRYKVLCDNAAEAPPPDGEDRGPGS